mmetsp:Transcript_1125/g.3846  ORF Transcript_1125/g.3846 Transcript_1125/m.3846 type:complete len:129 (-) Transcript_1125:749-1135(-)
MEWYEIKNRIKLERIIVQMGRRQVFEERCLGAEWMDFRGTSESRTNSSFVSEDDNVVLCENACGIETDDDSAWVWVMFSLAAHDECHKKQDQNQLRFFDVHLRSISQHAVKLTYKKSILVESHCPWVS